jgi:alpha-galactosidase
VSLGFDDGDHRTTWRVTASDQEVELAAVRLVWDLGPAGDLRLFANGYQSWSATQALRPAVDADPSRSAGTVPLVRAVFHADPGVADEGELRSEQVMLLARRGEPAMAAGFDDGADHAGTWRIRIVDGRIECTAEAWLGGTRFTAGCTRAMHSVTWDTGDEPAHLLERWADRAGAAAGARTRARIQTGWCSWYEYFEHVTEAAVRDNLARAQDWPIDVFQVDDGFQRSIGDWLMTNDRFPAGVDGIACAIDATGMTPGLWLAPFLAAPDSALVHTHPEWLVRDRTGTGFAIGMYNERWGGAMAMLDTTRADVREHLRSVAAELVAMGYRYLKLDFTFAPAMPGRFADPTYTPAQRVRAGFEAIRAGAGDGTFLLGCGAPLGATVGIVDGMRIGADVAPWWDPPADRNPLLAGYEATAPSTRNAFVNTVRRSFMHRRLWLNDPDCVMVRTSGTELPPGAARGWARVVGASGGSVVMSDDLGRLDADARDLFERTVATARAADDAARVGRTPQPIGLLDPDGPQGLDGSDGALVLDPATGFERG